MTSRAAIAVIALMLLPRHGDVPVAAVPADAAGRADAAVPAVVFAQQGLASYYGRGFDGKRTASGIRFDIDAMQAAHPRLPFGTVIRVTNRENGRVVDVTVVDRGPAKRIREKGVIVDLSPAAARSLDFLRSGKAAVRLEVVRAGPKGPALPGED